MKTLTTLLLCAVFSCVTVRSEAQIFKKLGDKIERSVERRLDRRMDEAVEGSLDKAEEGTERAVKDAVTTTAEPAKEAPPKATALPADFELELTGSGPDMYMEYQVSMEGEGFEDGQVAMSMKMYTAPAKGGGRAETIMTIPMIGEMKMISLTDFDNPMRLTILNERQKEYSVLDLSDVAAADVDEEYTVTKLGEEELHGMHTVHAKAVNQDGDAFEIWTTTEIPGYENIAALYSNMQKMGSAGLWDELQQAGAAGFMVKLRVVVEGGTSVMELVKVENTNVPESMLEVPADYVEKKGGWVNRYLQGMK